MQRTVNEQTIHLVLKRCAVLARLTFCFFAGDHDITERLTLSEAVAQRECEYISRSIHSAKTAIEPANRAIIRYHNGDVAHDAGCGARKRVQRCISQPLRARTLINRSLARALAAARDLHENAGSVRTSYHPPGECPSGRNAAHGPTIAAAMNKFIPLAGP